MAASSNHVQLRQLLSEKGFARTLPKDHLPQFDPAPTGIESIDKQLQGGLPRGRISEIVGRSSSGRTGLAFDLLAQATQRQEVTAYVDATDSLDPSSAQKSGIILERLLWVRCNVKRQPLYRRLALGKGRKAEEAWQAVNLVAASGGFGVIVLDLAGVPQRALRRWQGEQWRRLQRAIENTATTLIVLAEAHLTGSVASVVLDLAPGRVCWRGEERGKHVATGLSTNVRLGRN